MRWSSTTSRSGAGASTRSARWIIDHLPNDRRIVLVVIGFCVGCLLEGVAGFGAPVAITSALLIALGFPPIEALVFTLIFNTAPVAFGALGTPVTTLGAVTQLPVGSLASMIGRQLPFLALLLPFYVVAMYAGWKSLKSLWPVLLVAGGSFGLGQFLASNYIGYEPTDVISALACLVCDVAVPQDLEAGAGSERSRSRSRRSCANRNRRVPKWQGWVPWLLLSAIVIAWTELKLNLIGQLAIPWPGLAQRGLRHDLQPAVRRGVELAAARLGYGDPRHQHPDGVLGADVAGPSTSAAFADGEADDARRRHGGLRARARLRDELFRDDLHAGSRRGFPRFPVPARGLVPRLVRGIPHRQRHVGQCVVR